MPLLYSAPWKDISGYSVAARAYIKALYDAGIDIKLHSVKYDHRGSNDKFINDEFLQFAKKIELDELPDHDRFTFLSHAAPNVAYSTKARKKILYSVWESDHVPESFWNNLQNFDIVLTASEFSKNAFLATFPNLNIEVVPHIIHDFSEDKFYSPLSLIGQLKDKFVYFWNAEWHIGKGYDVLIDGFLKAFSGNKDVILLLKTNNLSSVNYKDSVIRYISNKKRELSIQYPSIIPLVGDMNYKDVLGLYKLAHVFLNTSRREGWSLTSSEAIGFGLPVIAPNKGGHTEFLTDDNALFVNSKWSAVSNNLELSRSLYAGQKWIEPDKDDFIEKLKYFYDNYESLKNDNWKQTVEKFSAGKIVKKFLRFIF